MLTWWNVVLGIEKLDQEGHRRVHTQQHIEVSNSEQYLRDQGIIPSVKDVVISFKEKGFGSLGSIATLLNDVRHFKRCRIELCGVSQRTACGKPSKRPLMPCLMKLCAVLHSVKHRWWCLSLNTRVETGLKCLIFAEHINKIYWHFFLNGGRYTFFFFFDDGLAKRE